VLSRGAARGQDSPGGGTGGHSPIRSDHHRRTGAPGTVGGIAAGGAGTVSYVDHPGHFRARLDNWAAVTLQRVWRGRVARRDAMLRFTTYTRASLTLQRVARRFLYRLAWRRMHERYSDGVFLNNNNINLVH
jgi:hypothetical protein